MKDGTRSRSRAGVAVAAVVMAGFVAGIVAGLPADRGNVQETPGAQVQSIEAYEIYSESAADLAARATVVFVGEIVGYQEDVLSIPPDPEDPIKASTIMDGIVFEVVDVVKGEVPGQVVVGTPVEVRDPSGQTRSELVDLPLGVVRSGIEALSRGEPARRYLVFAAPMDGAPGIHVFFGSRGVVEILPNGRLSTGAAPPFVERADGAETPVGERWSELRVAIAAAVNASEESRPAD